jgi:hypothetical protein
MRRDVCVLYHGGGYGGRRLARAALNVGAGTAGYFELTPTRIRSVMISPRSNSFIALLRSDKMTTIESPTRALAQS